MNRGLRNLLLGIVALVLLAGGAAYGYRWWHDHPPYGAADLHASVTLAVTDGDGLQAAVEKIGGPTLTPWYGVSTDRLFVGKIDYRVPSGAHGAGQYDIVVIDKQNQQVAPVIWGAASDQSAVRSGWQDALAEAGKRYDWLAAAADRPAGAAPGTVVYVPADTAGPITFQGAFHGDAGNISADDLLVALVFVGPDGQVYWADRLSG